jgi:hypothetical protein
MVTGIDRIKGLAEGQYQLILKITCGKMGQVPGPEKIVK